MEAIEIGNTCGKVLLLDGIQSGVRIKHAIMDH